jgi:hypothetical protein
MTLKTASLKPNSDRLSKDNADSILLYLQSSKASVMIHTSCCSEGGSPNDLSGVCIRGLIELSIRFFRTISEFSLDGPLWLNLRIRDIGVVVHLWWKAPNKGAISSTGWSLAMKNFVHLELNMQSCSCFEALSILRFAPAQQTLWSISFVWGAGSVDLVTIYISLLGLSYGESTTYE